MSNDPPYYPFCSLNLFLRRIAVFAFALCCSGCGLIIWPESNSYPDPVTRVRVVDASTLKPVAGAKINFRILASSHDGLGRCDIKKDPTWSTGTTDSSSGPEDSKHLFDNPSTLQFTSVDVAGEFSVDKTTKWGFAQFWWPLMVPYHGWVTHHHFESVFVADAPGYLPTLVFFSPDASELHRMPIEGNGTLVIPLDRVGSNTEKQRVQEIDRKVWKGPGPPP